MYCTQLLMLQAVFDFGFGRSKALQFTTQKAYFISHCPKRLKEKFQLFVAKLAAWLTGRQQVTVTVGDSGSRLQACFGRLAGLSACITGDGKCKRSTRRNHPQKSCETVISVNSFTLLPPFSFDITTCEQCNKLKIDLGNLIISSLLSNHNSWKLEERAGSHWLQFWHIWCCGQDCIPSDLSRTDYLFTQRFAQPLNEIYRRTRTHWAAFHWETVSDPSYTITRCRIIIHNVPDIFKINENSIKQKKKKAFWPVYHGQHFHLSVNILTNCPLMEG